MQLNLRPTTRLQQRYLYVFAIVFILIVWLLNSLLLGSPAFLADDPYIILHNAQVLHVGHDINYPGSPALTGTTSLVHLALVAFFMFLFSPLWALTIVNWLAVLVYALGLLRLACMFSATWLQALGVFIVGLGIAYLPLQLLFGLETGLALAVVTWTLIFFTHLSRKEKNSDRWVRNVLIGILPFVRPELVLLSLLLFIWQSTLYRHHNIVRNIIFDACIVLFSAAPWLLWYWLDLGVPFATTIFAKKYFFAEQYLPFSLKLQVAFINLQNFIRTVGYINTIGMLVLLSLTPIGRIGLIFLLGFFVSYTIYFPSALNFYAQHYFYIWIPILFYGVVSNLRHTDKLLRYGTNVLLFFLLCQTIIYFPAHWKTYLQWRQFNSNAMLMLKDWCNKNIPTHAQVLVEDAGYLAFTTQLQLNDMVGLKTPANVQYHKTITFPSIGKQRILAIATIMQTSKPNYLIITHEWNHAFHIVSGLQACGWQLKSLKPDDGSYLVYKIIPTAAACNISN